MRVGEWRLRFLGSHFTHPAKDSHVGPQVALPGERLLALRTGVHICHARVLLLPVGPHVALPAKPGTALGAQVHFRGARVHLLLVGIQRALALKDLVALIAQQAVIMLMPEVEAMRHFE